MVSLSFAYAALIMTHLASAFMFSLLICLILLVFLIFRQFSPFIKTVCAFACGVALSSIYFIPAFMERRYVHMEYLVNGPWWRNTDNFLFSKGKLLQEMPFYSSHFYSLLHLGVVADLVLFALILTVAKRHGVKPQRTVFTMFTASFVLTFLLTTPISKPLAHILPALNTLQFPWRWITFMELALAFLSGYIVFSAVESVASKPSRICISSSFLIYFILSATITCTTTMLSGKAARQFEIPPQSAYKLPLGFENIPAGAENWFEIWDGSPPVPVSYVVGKGIYSVELWEPQKRVVIFRSTLPSQVRVSTFYYPGWEAELDGKKTGITIERKSGAMLIDVPPGNHVLKLIFGETPLRTFSRYVSYSSCAILVLIAVLSFLLVSAERRE